jgi:two-component system, OmpR family, phosphate regulon sensor histidine kinase PhoR
VLNRSKSIVIILCAILALTGLQGLWLRHVMKSEEQNLLTNARIAGLEALQQLEQKEDLELLVSNLDTVIDFSQLTSTTSKKQNPQIKVIIANNSHAITIKNNNKKQVNSFSHSYSFNNSSSDSVFETTSMVFNGGEEQITAVNKKLNNKMKHYEHILKKIAVQSKQKNQEILKRISFDSLGISLTTALKNRGISLEPEYAILKNKDSVIKSTPGFNKNLAFVNIPMFTNDLIQQNYSLRFMFNRPWTYYYGKSIGMVVASALISLLLIILILSLYRKMRTEQLLNQYKNDFINNLTHELKTPLATITLANSNLKANAKYIGDERSVQYTNIVDEEAKRLNNHIEKVLALSTLEQKSEMLQVECVDLNVIIQHHSKSFQDMCQLQRGVFSVSLDALYATVNIDEAHFSNCLFALVDNALKYSREHPEIIITSTNEGNELRVAVKDNGIGISPEYRTKIFEKFFRVTEKNLHTIKGFGLGLSYVKQVIEMMGGRIELNSDLNKGSEFIICLPYAKA